jgi:hypothetical protein
MDGRLFPKTSGWKELYLAALFEDDRTRLAARIAEARAAIVSRARDLFHDRGNNIEEGQALDNALYALEAIAQCCLPEQEKRAAA